MCRYGDYLFLNEDSLEFANEYRMREVIEKYCSFMPVRFSCQRPTPAGV